MRRAFAGSANASATIRPSSPDEAGALTTLARRSKSHWGYDREFLDAVRDSPTLTPDDFEAGPIWVLELDRELTGFYHIIGDPPEGELSDLWFDQRAIGQGLGRTLFRHALETAAERGFETLLIESDPNAKGFYLRLGAEHVGHRRSNANRWLPLLRVAVPLMGAAHKPVDADARQRRGMSRESNPGTSRRTVSRISRTGYGTLRADCSAPAFGDRMEGGDGRD